MKKLLGIVFILLFATATVFASFLTPAIGDGRIIPVGDDFYSYVDALFISTGNAIPSTSRPWTVTEARNELEKLNGVQLSESEKKILDDIYSSLPKVENHISLSLNLSPEIYAHINSDFNREEYWNYGYEDRNHFGTISLDNATGGFQGHLELSAGLGMVTNGDLDNEMTLKEYAKMVNGSWEGVGTQVPADEEVEEGTLKADEIKVLGSQKVYTSPFLFNFPSTGTSDLNMPRKAYLDYSGSNFSIGFYKDRKAWGNNKTGNFIFDAHNPYYNTLTLKTFNSKFSFEYTYMMPEQYRGGKNSSDHNYEEYQRVFTAHRVEYRATSSLSFALSENVMYRFYGMPDITNMNPATFYHNNLNNHQFNALAHVELAYTFLPGFMIYGQVGVDQGSFPGFEDPSTEDQAMGFSLGLQHSSILEDSFYTISFEALYTTPALYRPTGSTDFIINYNFLMPSSYYRYPFFTYIGYEHGGDNLEFRLDADYYYRDLHMYGALDLRFQGDYGMFDQYSHPLPITGNTTIYFTGNLGTEYSLDLKWFPTKAFCDLSLVYIEDKGFDPQLSLGASISYSI